MFIFNKYYFSFVIKLTSIKNLNHKCFKHNFNYKNKIIHNTVIFVYINLFYNNVILYKNKFKKYNSYPFSSVNYFNNKILLESIF
jgi:hypothetical protein